MISMSVIDDIKKEIKSKTFSEDYLEDVCYFDDVIAIIDKYTSRKDTTSR